MTTRTSSPAIQAPFIAVAVVVITAMTVVGETIVLATAARLRRIDRPSQSGGDGSGSGYSQDHGSYGSSHKTESYETKVQLQRRCPRKLA